MWKPFFKEKLYIYNLDFELKSASYKASFHCFYKQDSFYAGFLCGKIIQESVSKSGKKSCCIMFFVKINHPKFIFEPKLYMQNCDKLCTTAKLKRLFVQTT